jgi:hypothetical protein
VSNLFLSGLIKQFGANNLVINFDKKNIMKFIIKNSSRSTLYIDYKEKYLGETLVTKFLGSQIDNHMNRKNRIEQTIPKLSAVCYAIRLMVHICNINTLRSIYCAYIHSTGGTRWRSWLRHCATSRKVTGSIPDGVIGIFHLHNPSGRTIALGSTQPLTEMSTRNISWG